HRRAIFEKLQPRASPNKGTLGLRVSRSAAMFDDAHELRTAALLEHERGDREQATALFRRILKLHPISDAATDALYYLTTGERRPAGPALSAGSAPDSGSAV